ncbi:type II CRISPR RNA-guided endonuclease Cas9, partial [Candidatus Cetobacterium colombiensis]
MEKKFRLGLDIGIASVGWAIVSEDENIIDAGVRLFPEGGSSVTSAERRVKRASRRLLRRRHHRIERLRKLLFENKIIETLDYDFYINEITPYELRVKGLTEKLTNRELAIALL